MIHLNQSAIERVYPLFEQVGKLADTLKAEGHRHISLCGAGKNAHLLVGMLPLHKIEIDRIYDDSDQQSRLDIPVTHIPERFDPNELVLLTLAPSHPAYASMLGRLQDSGARLACFGSDFHPSEIMRNDGPVRHALENRDFAKYRDRRLQAFKNRHDGETCVIMGNGPSLNHTDFSLLEGIPTFGLNKIFLMFKRTSFRPTYICCYIKDVIAQCVDEFTSLTDIPLFLSHEALDLIPPTYDHIYYLGPHQRFSFCLDPINSICSGFTVTYVAMQLAFYMGFKRIVLIGVDHNFAGYKGPGNKWFKINNPKPTHFDPNYFAKGQHWQAPDFRMIEAHFAFARAAGERLGVEIIDATDGGHLNIFPKTYLKSALTDI